MCVWDTSVCTSAEALRTEEPLVEGEHSERETGQDWKLSIGGKRNEHRREQEVPLSSMLSSRRGGGGGACRQCILLWRVGSRSSCSAVSEAEDKSSGVRNEELLPSAPFI